MRFVFRNKLVSVRIGKVQSRAGSLTISTASASASLQVKGLIYPMAEKSLLDILLFKLSSHESVAPQEDLRVSPGHSLLCVIWRIILGQQHYHQHFPVR